MGKYFWVTVRTAHVPFWGGWREPIARAGRWENAGAATPRGLPAGRGSRPRGRAVAAAPRPVAGAQVDADAYPPSRTCRSLLPHPPAAPTSPVTLCPSSRPLPPTPWS